MINIAEVFFIYRSLTSTMTTTTALRLVLAMVITVQAVSGLPLSQRTEIKVRERIIIVIL